MADVRDPVRPGDHVVTTCDLCPASLYDSVPYQFADGTILCEDCGEARLAAKKAAEKTITGAIAQPTTGAPPCPCCGGRGKGGDSTCTPWVCPVCKGKGITAATTRPAIAQKEKTIMETVSHCAECEFFGENIDASDHAPDHGAKGGETSSQEFMEFPTPAFERARLVLDVHTGFTRRNYGAVESRIVDLIADALLLADRWNLPTGRILERANAQAFPMPESGRKGGEAGSAVAEAPSAGYAGIDYGMGASNVDRATGIRYGVIAQHSLCQEALSVSMEPDYGDPHCPECSGEVLMADEVTRPDLWTRRMDRDGTHGCFDYACLKCRKGFDSSRCYSDEPVDWIVDGGGEYDMQTCLDTDVMILKSPYYTHVQFCSPCVPGAGNLDSPMPNGVRTFCLGHDWFEGGVAPYPVYFVSDDSEVSPDPAPGGMTLRQWHMTAPVGFAINDNMPLVTVPDVPAIVAIRAFLWNLVDYRVESVRAGTIFLARRAKTGESS